MTDNLKATIKSAINGVSPRYLELRSLLLATATDLTINSEHTPRDSKKTSEQTKPLSLQDLDNWFKKNGENDLIQHSSFDMLWLKKEGILITRFHGTTQTDIYTVEDCVKPLYCDTSFSETFSADEFIKISQSLINPEENDQDLDDSTLDDSTLYDMEYPYSLLALASIRAEHQKSFTKEQIKKLIEEFGRLTNEIIYDESLRLNKLTQDTLFIPTWTHITDHVVRKRGILSLDKMLHLHDSNAVTLTTQQRRSLTLKLIKAVKKLHETKTIHNAICAHNIAIDIDDHNQIEVFLKNTHYAIDTAQTPSNSTNTSQFKTDLEQLLTLIQQVMLGTNEPKSIPRLLEIIPEIATELAVIEKTLLDETSYGIIETIKILEMKKTQLDGLRNLKDTTNNLTGNELSTIASIQKSVRSSPDPEKISQDITELLKLENLTQIKTDDSGRSTPELSPRIPIFSQKPLSPEIKTKIKKAISPREEPQQIPRSSKKKGR